jgi:hypothetical protein
MEEDAAYRGDEAGHSLCQWTVGYPGGAAGGRTEYLLSISLLGEYRLSMMLVYIW